ncbi:multiple sugar transport system permease protein [Arthrobacter sp. B2I5]|uniref:carbohydrate ABC transporter permease n=1 Tax=Arthrobacter sp. B2I5 TaxID=3042266 RepID=UPI00278AAD66|nr:sugar ABC transporter permease [Arthrobacter sp. B2I5]MDQ0825620.1 multiple sugar transport system permease protein [Arthrobacter sp. B2I5]
MATVPLPTRPRVPDAPKPALPPSDAKTNARRRPGFRRDQVSGWGMIAPAALLLLAFVFIPAILGFGLAFTNARLISPRPVEFVGMDNFARLFTDPTFYRALLNVAYFTVVIVPVQSGLALVLALLINKKFRGVNFFRTVYFLPVVTSMVVVSLLWLFMYRKDGLINEILSSVSFGLINGPDWLGDPNTAMPAIIILSIWQAAGFHMIIWLAGLQGISGELYEAAQLDGTSRWQQFRYVTWPGLFHTRSLVLVTITIQALGLFDQISVMTQGGPMDSTTTIVYEAVRSGYRQQETSYASAISLVFFVLVLIVSAVQRYLTREKD